MKQFFPRHKGIVHKALSLVFIVAIIASCFAVNVYAASAVSSVNCQSTAKMGGGSVYFYVKASGKTSKLKFTCGKGKLNYGGMRDYISVYGAYEVKIYKWDKNSGKTTGSCIKDVNIYNASSKTIQFNTSKNCYYRVQVYFWKASTTSSSYFNKSIINSGLVHDGVGCLCEPYWVTLPTIRATNASGCTLYSSKP